MRPSTSRIGWRSCKVPVAQGQPLSLERRNRKIRSFQKVEYRLGISGVGARRRFTEHAHRGPRLHVQRGHVPRIQFDEPVLHLNRAPLILRRVPTGRYQSGRACDRSRVPGAIGQIGREHFAFIRRDENVIGRRSLREHRHLTLDQGHAAVGAARAAGILKRSLLNDLGAKARSGAAQRIRIELVLIMRAGHQQPALPLFPHQILRERVREHRARRRDMDDIGAAIALTQAVVDRAGVEQHGSALANARRRLSATHPRADRQR